jgi:hypothetical protein
LQRRHDDRCWSSPASCCSRWSRRPRGWPPEAVTLGEVQLLLGDGFVVSIDRDGAVLERVRFVGLYRAFRRSGWL